MRILRSDYSIRRGRLRASRHLDQNATGWVADTFSATPEDRFGHQQVRVSAETIDRQFAVDARGSALLIAEFARRHVVRGGMWGRIIGLTSGGPTGFPNEVSYGAAKAALENYTMSAAFELAGLGITANIVPARNRYRVGH